MKLPYKRCSPQSSGTPGEGGRWGRHIYQSAVNAFSAFANGNRCPMLKAEPDCTEEIRKLPQAEELRLEYGIHLYQSDTFGLQPGGGQKAGAICTQAV